ncbi:MAG TPA: hypothetical protein DDY39_14450 [Nitrospira sp.]|nr:hypothetical protein [Nitrospira sp.]HBR50362.1 hypothetical protein [Nitrospira sp.]
MVNLVTVRTIISEDEVKGFEEALRALELGLVTVQKVIERMEDEKPPTYKSHGIHMGLYVLHTQAVLMLCRQLLVSNKKGTL